MVDQAGDWQMKGKDPRDASEQSLKMLRVDAPITGADPLRGCWETACQMEKAASRGDICCFVTLSNLSGFKLEADRKAEGLLDQVRTSGTAT